MDYLCLFAIGHLAVTRHLISIEWFRLFYFIMKRTLSIVFVMLFSISVMAQFNFDPFRQLIIKDLDRVVLFEECVVYPKENTTWPSRVFPQEHNIHQSTGVD